MFKLPPFIYGSICFIHDHSLEKDKLYAKSIKCIFLGYSRSQKESRSYSPHLNKYFMFVDVPSQDFSFLWQNPFCLRFYLFHSLIPYNSLQVHLHRISLLSLINDTLVQLNIKSLKMYLLTHPLSQTAYLISDPPNNPENPPIALCQDNRST